MSNHAKYRWIATGLAIAAGAGALCIWRSVSSRGGNAPIAAAREEQQIWVETCRPISVLQPLEVAGIGENGEKGLYCAPGGGVATENEGGSATYRFHVPAAGRYRLWGYCRWLDAKGDGFAVDLGDARSTVGKTGSVGQWRWLPLADAQLAAGVGRTKLTAKGDGFAVRRLFLCDDLARHPSQSRLEPVDIFLDDYDGCEEGEFDSWGRVSGRWVVHRREDDKRPASKMLVGTSASEALIHVGTPDWRDYSVMLDCRTVRASPGSSAAVKFCCDQVGSGLVLRWTAAAPGQVHMELLREGAAGVRTLDRFTAAWDTSRWSEVSIEAWQGSVRIGIDSMPVRTIQVGDPGGGAIGLWLQGDIEMAFDNVQVLGQRVRGSPATQQATPAARHDGNEQRRTDTHHDEDP